jgi:hypothetical protein
LKAFQATGPFFSSSYPVAVAETTSLAAEIQKLLRAAAFTLDTGKPVHGVAAVEKALYHIASYRLKSSTDSLETMLINSEKALPMVTKDSIEEDYLQTYAFCSPSSSSSSLQI